MPLRQDPVTRPSTVCLLFSMLGMAVVVSSVRGDSVAPLADMEDIYDQADSIVAGSFDRDVTYRTLTTQRIAADGSEYGVTLRVETRVLHVAELLAGEQTASSVAVHFIYGPEAGPAAVIPASRVVLALQVYARRGLRGYVPMHQLVQEAADPMTLNAIRLHATSVRALRQQARRDAATDAEAISAAHAVSPVPLPAMRECGERPEPAESRRHRSATVRE